MAHLYIRGDVTHIVIADSQLARVTGCDDRCRERFVVRRRDNDWRCEGQDGVETELETCSLSVIKP
jgi:hypothetical protein